MNGDAPIPSAALPRCNDCAHYYITHDTRLPYGCHALGFKSQQQPVRVVMAASAQQCHYFQAKK